MAEIALFIGAEDLNKYSPLVGNLDADKVMGFIEVAQEIHITNYIGTDLYNALQVYALAGTMPAEYSLLVDSYIVPALIRWSLVEYLPTAPYTVANGGVYKHKSENSESINKEELDSMVHSVTNTAKHYTKRLIDFMCNNSSDYPEYNTNSGSDIYPSKNDTYGGLYLK